MMKCDKPVTFKLIVSASAQETGS